MKLPEPKQLAQAIANTSLSLQEKKALVRNLIFLNEEKICKLYELLINLQEEESKFITQVERIDFKYKIKIEEEIEKEKFSNRMKN